MYEQVLSLPQWSRPSLDAIELSYIHERLGALYESRGDARNAVAHYHALSQLCKNADPELQPRVQKARAAVRRLAGLEPPARP